MFQGLARCAFLAALLHCVGCSLQAVDAKGGVQHEEHPSSEHAIQRQMENTDRRTSAEGPTLRPSSGSSPESRALADSTYLPTESELIEEAGISAAISDEIVESQDAFSKALRRISSDENSSMEAQDLAKHYRSAFERAVGTSGAVENISCGLSICIGSVTAGSIADHDAWLGHLQEDPGAETYGFIEAIERNGDQFQSRFVFSTDPAINAIIEH
jgi:hypothetical protein